MPQTIHIQEISVSDEAVPAEAFGINYTFNYQRFGDKPWEKFDEITEDYQPSHIRFPDGSGSETVFDIRNPDATIFVDADGEVQSLTPMTDMLQFAAETGVSAVVVIPTRFALDPHVSTGHRTFDETTEQVYREYIQFLLHAIGDGNLSRLEVGNEYQSYMSSIEYGRIASRVAEIIQEEITAFRMGLSDGDSWVEPEIAVQIFGQSTHGGIDIAELDQRNENVLAQFDQTQLDAIDAVVDHFYYFEGRNEGDVNEHNINNVDQAISVSMDRIDVWNIATGRELTHAVSEWNVSHNSPSVHGLRQIPYLTNLISAFVENGVDELDFWSSQYHPTSLYNPAGEAMIAGLIFTEFRDQIVGANVVSILEANEDVVISGFQLGDAMTLFISSTSNQSREFDMRFEHSLFNYRVVGTTTISVVIDSADGAYRDVSDLPYYVEPDVDYLFTDQSYGSNTTLSDLVMSIGAYETVVVELNLGLAPQDQDSIPVQALTTTGDDILIFSADVPTYYGGDGFDNVSYAENAIEGITVDIAELVHLGTFNSIEGVIGSIYADTLRGDSAANTILGDGGNDVINGRLGDDHIYGGNGNDTLLGGAGADTLDGGNGLDLASYHTSWSGVTVDLSNHQLNTNDARGDVLWSIESVLGSQYADNLIGNERDNAFYGDAGDDSLDGGLGTDILSGGAGNDRFHSSGVADWLLGGAGNDVFNLSSRSTYADDIFGYSALTGQMVSLAGLFEYSQTIEGDIGYDVLNLGNGDDAFFLHNNVSALHQDLLITIDVYGMMGTARISEIERINSGAGDDFIDLTSLDYSLASQSLVLSGGAGNDTIWGSDANERIFGGTGNDVLFGGFGRDVLSGGSGADSFEFIGQGEHGTILDFSVDETDRIRFIDTTANQFDRFSLHETEKGIGIDFEDSVIGQNGTLEIEFDLDVSFETLLNFVDFI